MTATEIASRLLKLVEGCPDARSYSVVLSDGKKVTLSKEEMLRMTPPELVSFVEGK